MSNLKFKKKKDIMRIMWNVVFMVLETVFLVEKINEKDDIYE